MQALFETCRVGIKLLSSFKAQKINLVKKNKKKGKKKDCQKEEDDEAIIVD